MEKAKPPQMTRALERAARTAWAAGREARTLHIRALETRVRESNEDYLEIKRAYEDATARMYLGFQIQMTLEAAAGISYIKSPNLDRP